MSEEKPSEEKPPEEKREPSPEEATSPKSAREARHHERVPCVLTAKVTTRTPKLLEWHQQLHAVFKERPLRLEKPLEHLCVETVKRGQAFAEACLCAMNITTVE